MALSEGIAFAALLILAAGWIGYPLALIFISRVRHRPATEPVRSLSDRRKISIIIATRDHPLIVAKKLRNLQSSAFPTSDVEVIVAVDQRAIAPAADYEELLLDSNVRVVSGDKPGGKAVTLNAAVRASAGEILIFTDSSQDFAEDAIANLERCLATTRYAVVSGNLVILQHSPDRSVLGMFWKYELAIRRSEALVHSLVAVTGAVYAMRREVWVPLPAGLICDDLFVPLVAVQNGYRVGFCKSAVAVDSRVFTKSQEFRRKVRTLTGVIQLCVIRPSVLLPWANPIWPQFVCHKLIRLLTPYLLLIAAAGSLAISTTAIPRRLLIGIVTGAMAFVGFSGIFLPDRLARRLWGGILWAALLTSAPLLACARAIRGRWDVW
jgi:poly-beta-1,6-N-acetyl-D-glucosamine synthase